MKCFVAGTLVLTAAGLVAIETGMLKAGAELVDKDYNIIRIEEVRCERTEGTKVYNFQVEGYHTYCVGEEGIWVHNADCGTGAGARKGSEDTNGKDSEGGLNSVSRTIKDVEAPILPEGSQWERNVLNSFAGGKSNPVTYEGGTVLYRVGGKNGGFWSLDVPPATEYQWRVDTAIKQEFCNDASTLYTMTIPQGASLSGIEGKVGSQGMGLYGGAHQVYIDYRAVPEDWIEISKMIWK